LRGWTKVRSHHLADGIADLQSSVESFDQLGARWSAARTRRLLAAALRVAGEQGEASAVQSGADAVYAELRVVRDPVIESALAQL
jgi:hypothetical protein